MDGDPQLQANREANEADPQTKAFLDDIAAVYKKHNMMLDRVSQEEPMLIVQLGEDGEEFLYSAVDTTREGFEGL